MIRPGTGASAGDDLRLRAALVLAAGAALIRPGAWPWLAAYGAGVAVLAASARPPMTRLARVLGAEVALLALMVLPMGWERATFALGRAWTSLLAVDAVVLAMGTEAATAALVRLPAPGPLRDVVVLAARYGQVLGGELVRARQAAGARGLVAAGPWARRAGVAMIGASLVRALDRADRVHAAMLARGYSQPLPSALPAGSRERRLMAGIAAAAAVMVGGSYLWP
ncbi:MAG: energy-coupling factor transporter transmembrane protein EcfT [Limnochordaceae bacterium]|nr:energy-coupling factor transporter transmembrane protein EcfT [Limnochordaceae bacterium]